jgi:hypothetical protein
MFRQHAPLPDAQWVTAAKTIRLALNECGERGDKPAAIVMGEDLASIFRGWGGGGWSYGRPELFGLPVRIDRRAQGWSVRPKTEAGQG